MSLESVRSRGEMAGSLLGGLFGPLLPDSLLTHESLAHSNGAAVGSLPVPCGAGDPEEGLGSGTFLPLADPDFRHSFPKHLALQSKHAM